MNIRNTRPSIQLATAGAGLLLLTLTGCSGSSGPDSAAAASQAVAPNQPAAPPTATTDGCKLVTPAELSKAVGVQYTAIDDGGGSLCNVTAADPTASFTYAVGKVGPTNTWEQQIGIIKRDDGSEINVSGIGDKAIQGAIKEFAAEAKGYIVIVINGDVNNPATASKFTRTKKIEQLLISKL